MDTTDVNVVHYDLADVARMTGSAGKRLRLETLDFVGKESSVFADTEKMKIKITWRVSEPLDVYKRQGQADALQQLHRLGVSFGLLHQAQLDRGQRDVLFHRQVGEQVEMLEHHAHLLAHMVNIVVGHSLAVEDDLAAVRLFQPVQACRTQLNFRYDMHLSQEQ